MASERRLEVTSVNDGGNAEFVGLKPGDVLEEMGGIFLTSPAALDAALSKNAGGVILVAHRDGERLSFRIPQGRMGIMVVEIDFDAAEYFKERELNQRVRDMLVTTTQSVEGFRIAKTIDIVTAECVFGLNVFKDFFMGLTDFFGGRSGTAQTALRDARKSCLHELKREAAMAGANAVVGVDLDYSEFTGKGTSMLFLVASGTAVIIEPIE